MSEDKIITGDFDDAGRRVVIVSGGDQDERAAQLARHIEESQVQGLRVITADSLGVRDQDRTRVIGDDEAVIRGRRAAHRSASLRAATVMGIAASLGVPLDGYQPTGAMRSNMRRREREQRQPQTPHDLERIAAAEAKRARKAAKRSKK